MPDRLNSAEKVVGLKQTLRAVSSGRATSVYVAADADPLVTAPVISLCEEKGVPVVTVPFMRALGEACGIKTGAAAAAIVSK